MAHESCKSQIAVLEMNGQSVPQRWTFDEYFGVYVVCEGQESV